jgi:hypothetical protein
MPNEPEIDAVLARRQEIAAQIEQLRAEDAELEVAIRVLKRFSKIAKTGNGQASLTPKLGPPRPDGTPPLFDMVEKVLLDAISSGKPGLRGQEIVTEIGRKYWPGVQGRQILPPIYQFAKNDRIHKSKDGVFRPVKATRGG